VCRLYGVGRDAGPNCLGGADGDNRYWAYFRAPAGTSTFKYSSIGGGASRVHDGDVEGWKFGTGTAPAFVSLASLLPPPPPPTQPPATAPPATNPSAATPGAPGAGPGSTPAAVPGAPVAPGATTTSSTLPLTGAAAKDAARQAGSSDVKGDEKSHDAKSSERTVKDEDGKTVSTSLASSDSDSGGGSAASLLWVAALLFAIAAAILIVRRVRKQSSAGSSA
jgi:hypothetical protein